jgi:4,5-DOPA dioxygenase extradiol
MSTRMPVIYLPHGGGPWPWMESRGFGGPGAWTGLRRYLQGLPAQLGEPPKAVLAISAHWEEPVPTVMTSPSPPMLYDYSGFPPETYQIRWPAPGDPALAARVVTLLAAGSFPIEARADTTWGLDHGAWSVLCHLRPAADVPVLQVSLDETRAPSFHFELGRRLRPLRDEGVLVLGSGNLVHNLHAYAWGRHPVEPFAWAVRFETFARERIAADDPAPLVDYEAMGRDAVLAVPTPDHYLPLLAVLGARHPGEPASFPVEGIDGGSISMLSVRLG